MWKTLKEIIGTRRGDNIDEIEIDYIWLRENTEIASNLNICFGRSITEIHESIEQPDGNVNVVAVPTDVWFEFHELDVDGLRGIKRRL